MLQPAENKITGTEKPLMAETLEKSIYPFTAIVGKERAKLGLILCAIDSSIGGILLTGPKGSGKSTLVRAAARIFPDIETVEGCPFNCSPTDPTNMCDICRAQLESHGTLPKTKKQIQLTQIPISATEDRVVGSIDVDRVLKEGVRALHSGLLAQANQGILYLDETNLLPDHLVDTILDAAASGWNIVEREGISATHPARFTLIGTMNPEEGELRPQLTDRFGLHVKVENISDIQERVDVIRRNIEFKKNPDDFFKRFELEDEKIRREIADARDALPKVVIPQHVLDTIAHIHFALRVDGYRPDIVTIKAARAHAAYMRRLEITPEDIQIASELTLTHRTRNAGREQPPTIKEIDLAIKGTKTARARIIPKHNKQSLRLLHTGKGKKKQRTINPLLAILMIIPVMLLLIPSLFSLSPIFFESPLEIALLILAYIALILVGGMLHQRPSAPQVRLLDIARITATRGLEGKFPQIAVEDPEGGIRTPSMADLQNERRAMLREMKNEMVGTIPKIPKDTDPLKPSKLLKGEKALRGTQYLVGKRAKVVTSSAKGRYTYYQPPKKKPWDIALVPTLRVASRFQRRRSAEGVSLVVRPEDLQVKIREYRAPFSITLLVDMSFSMTSSLSNISRAIFSLHRSVWRRRDRVSLIVFKGKDAVVLQQPTTNLDMAVERLRKVETGDFTPMATGLLRAWRLLRLEKQRNKDVVPMLIVLSDGIVNVELNHPLSSTSRMSYASEAQADVIDMAHILKRDGIRVIVINTSHRIREIAGDAFTKITTSREWYTPTELMLELAKMTDGSYYGLSLGNNANTFVRKSRLDDWFFYEANA